MYIKRYGGLIADHENYDRSSSLECVVCHFLVMLMFYCGKEFAFGGYISIKFCKIEFLWRWNLAHCCIAPNFCSVIKTSDLYEFAKHLVKNTCNYVPHDHSIHVSCGKQLQSLKPVKYWHGIYRNWAKSTFENQVCCFQATAGGL